MTKTSYAFPCLLAVSLLISSCQAKVSVQAPAGEAPSAAPAGLTPAPPAQAEPGLRSEAAAPLAAAPAEATTATKSSPAKGLGAPAPALGAAAPAAAAALQAPQPAAPPAAPPPPAPPDLLAFETGLMQGAAMADETAARAIEAWATALETRGAIDAAIARLSAAAATGSAPPQVSFALAALYGRKGLIDRQYAALAAVEASAKAKPNVVFSLAAVYGRKELLKSQYSEDELMPASIEVVSEPVGARVFLDGAERGIAPLSLGKLKHGSHSVRLQIDRYRAYEKTLSLGLGEAARLPVSLEPMPGTITVTTTPPTKVGIPEAGQSKMSPAVFEGLAPGKYSIRILDFLVGRRYMGLESPIELELEPAGRISLAPKFVGGKSAVTFFALPEGGRIFLDGTERKIEDNIGVDAGLVDVEVRGGGGAVWRGTADVSRTNTRFINAEKLLYELPRRAIKIDGNTEDWGDLSPLLTDATSDDKMPKRTGTNIEFCYLCRDDKNVYVRIEYADGKPEWFKGIGRGFSFSKVGGSQIAGMYVYSNNNVAKTGIYDEATKQGQDCGSYRATASGYEASYPLANMPSGLPRNQNVEAWFYVNTWEIDGNASEDGVGTALVLIGK